MLAWYWGLAVYQIQRINNSACWFQCKKIAHLAHHKLYSAITYSQYSVSLIVARIDRSFFYFKFIHPSIVYLLSCWEWGVVYMDIYIYSHIFTSTGNLEWPIYITPKCACFCLFFWLWEEVVVAGENLHRNRDTIQTPHRNTLTLNLTWDLPISEVTVLSNAPLCLQSWTVEVKLFLLH